MQAIQQIQQGIQQGVQFVQSKLGMGGIPQQLPPELQPLANSVSVIIDPTQWIPCCNFTKLPQYFYSISVADTVIAHIMHGSQSARIPCFTGLCGQLTNLCGKQCKDTCMLCMRKCGNACTAIMQCVFFCKCLAYCCSTCTKFVPDAQQFQDYENVVEVKHLQTALGWGISEKDGLYAANKEFAVGAFHQVSAPIQIDWIQMERNRMTVTPVVSVGGSAAAGALDLLLEAAKIDELDLTSQGVPEIKDEVVNKVDYVFACLTCTPFKKYQLQRDSQQYFTQSYPITYLNKYIGRYIFGNQTKKICETFFPCCIMRGYTYVDEVYLLDQFDNLIYKCRQKELGYYAACYDQNKGRLYKVEIQDPQGNQLGSMTKRIEFFCCGLKFKWVFEVNYPKDIKPTDKVLLTFLFPYLNEAYMNIWNQGSSHKLENLPHDRQIPEMKRGVDKVLTDRLVDIMNFDGVDERNIPGKITEILSTNQKTREFGHIQRVSTYEKSPSLIREYARKRRLQIKKKLLDDLIIKFSKEQDEMMEKMAFANQ